MKMSYEKVKQASKTIIGTKQAVKAMRAGQVTELFIALDADSWVTDPVILIAKEVGVPVNLVESKKELGKACGIHVGAAVVAIAAM
jgi:large subunit ribosomal protein L7A